MRKVIHTHRKQGFLALPFESFGRHGAFTAFSVGLSPTSFRKNTLFLTKSVKKMSGCQRNLGFEASLYRCLEGCALITSDKEFFA